MQGRFRKWEKAGERKNRDITGRMGKFLTDDEGGNKRKERVIHECYDRGEKKDDKNQTNGENRFSETPKKSGSTQKRIRLSKEVQQGTHKKKDS